MVLRIYRNYCLQRESPGIKNDRLNEIYYALITYNTARTTNACRQAREFRDMYIYINIILYLIYVSYILNIIYIKYYIFIYIYSSFFSEPSI